MKKINLRKRRNGQWCSMSTGGSYNSPNVKDDAASDADDSDDEDDDDGDEPKPKPKRSRQQLSNEAARRRRENRELRAENERLKAQLADDGKSTGASDGLRSDLVMELAGAGLKKDQIRAAMKLVDLDEYDNVDEAIEDLRDQYPSVFTSDSPSDKMGRSAPAMNNGRRKPGKETEDQRRIRLSQKYPALQGRWSPR